MIYSELVDFIGATFQLPITSNTSASPFLNTDANTILPKIISLAEYRLYGALELMANDTIDYSTKCSTGTRYSSIISTTRVCNGINVITPVNANPDDVGATRNFCERVDQSFVDMMYPNSLSSTGVPKYFAMKDNKTLIFAPAPDNTYTIENMAEIYPPPISASNTSTYLSVTYPQLMMAAVAISWAGYQRDYGAQSEDPRLSLAWKAEYDGFLRDAIIEEKRRQGLPKDGEQATASSAPPMQQVS